ncbi:BRO-N domain-containing protein [Pseudomonas indica]|uniref:Prophage antirepressor n=1 Tax=Pseudomonas indica TaxID=137658 RepID=A0A1G9MFI3_9PSED|nr:BRO family protein [Pseudomonas indica]SDL73020.1 Prophage antirepressor [Pseudomonas indica]
MQEALTPTLFTRHNHSLRALLIDDQAWFSIADLAVLLGCPNDIERIADHLATDQQRSEWMFTPHGLKETLLIDESGLYAALLRDTHPESEGLRRWIAHRVIPELRNSDRSEAGSPRYGTLHWKASGVQVIHWQDRLWIALDDIPQVIRSDALRPSAR